MRRILYHFRIPPDSKDVLDNSGAWSEGNAASPASLVVSLFVGLRDQIDFTRKIMDITEKLVAKRVK